MWLFVHGHFVPRYRFLQEDNADARLAAYEIHIATSLKNYKEMTPRGALRQNPARSMIRVEFLRDRCFNKGS